MRTGLPEHSVAIDAVLPERRLERVVPRVSGRLYIARSGVGMALSCNSSVGTLQPAALKLLPNNFWVGQILKESTVHQLHDEIGNFLFLVNH